MKAVDKSGREIYPAIFNQILREADKLLKVGYCESVKKPNLFFFNNGDITYFADFRGTEIVPIYSDTRPLIYWLVNNKSLTEREILSRILLHFEVLGSNEIESRVSFYEEAEPGFLSFDYDEYIEKYIHAKFKIPLFLIENENFRYTDQNGKCRNCNSLFRKPGFFCSDECRLIFIKKYIVKILNKVGSFCEVCGSMILNPYLLEEFSEYVDVKAKPRYVTHHTSYYPERTLHVCEDCHKAVHHTDRYPELKPLKGESRKYYAKKKHKYMAFDRVYSCKLNTTGTKCYDFILFFPLPIKPAVSKGEYISPREPAVSDDDSDQWIICKKCAHKFDGRYRTTCPKCRTFFR